MRSITPIPLQSTPSDHHHLHHEEELPSKSTYEEPVSTYVKESIASKFLIECLLGSRQCNRSRISRIVWCTICYRSQPTVFPFHVFLLISPHFSMATVMLINWMRSFKLSTRKSSNTNCKVNEKRSRSRWLFVSSYPNADELRSIVSRLVDRHPNSIAVIGSVELLVRKLYYKFCNERKKYPVELKRRQPNKRKRLMREDEANIMPVTQSNPTGRNSQTMNDLDRLMHLWTNTSNNQSECRDTSVNDQSSHQQQDGFQSPSHSASGSSSNSSSPDSHARATHTHPSTIKREPFCPLNLSMATANHANLMCTE